MTDVGAALTLTAINVALTAAGVSWCTWRARRTERRLDKHLDSHEFITKLEAAKRRRDQHTLTTNGAGR